jgi:hypothetical protein
MTKDEQIKEWEDSCKSLQKYSRDNSEKFLFLKKDYQELQERYFFIEKFIRHFQPCISPDEMFKMYSEKRNISLDKIREFLVQNADRNVDSGEFIYILRESAGVVLSIGLIPDSDGNIAHVNIFCPNKFPEPISLFVGFKDQDKADELFELCKAHIQEHNAYIEHDYDKTFCVPNKRFFVNVIY